MAKVPELSTFLSLVKATGLDVIFRGSQPVTVFAPSNDGIKAVLAVYSKLDDAAKRDVLRNHIVIGAAVQAKQLVQGGQYRTLDRQQLIASQDTKKAWHISNQDKSVVSDVLKTDIKGATGNAGTGDIIAVAHMVSAVLLPVVVPDIGSLCTDVSPTCRVVPADVCARAQKPTGTGNSDCAASTVTTVQRDGQCCKDNCFIFRHQNGVGDMCRRTPITRPAPVTDPSPSLKACPASCKSTFDNCKKKYQNPETCLKYAAQGQLCSSAGTATTPCDASAFLKNDGGECGGGQTLQCTYKPCLVGTFCENADNADLRAQCKEAYISDPSKKNCIEECQCPRGQSYDNAQQKCVKQCGDVTQCESTIAQNFLDSGANAAKCAGTDVGDTCKASCLSFTCVSKPDQKEGMDRYCTPSKDEKTCNTPLKYNGKSYDICEWLGAGGAGPSWVCSMSNGDADWTISTPGQCRGGGGGAEEACDYFRETQCLVDSECPEGGPKAECQNVVASTLKRCSSKCFNSKIIDDDQCSGCIYDSLMTTDGVNPGETDATACCGCLDDAFIKQGVDMTAKELNLILSAPCKKVDPVDMDDDDSR